LQRLQDLAPISLNYPPMRIYRRAILGFLSTFDFSPEIGVWINRWIFFMYHNTHHSEWVKQHPTT